MTLYLEAVRPTATETERTITIEFYEGNGTTLKGSDTVLVTATSLDLDVDSDNTSDLLPERTPFEDQIEVDPKRPGKIVLVNDVDRDGDQIPDFADGFNRDGASMTDSEYIKDDVNTQDHFVPVVLQLPAGATYDSNVATLTISYAASDPMLTQKIATGDGTAYVPARGQGAGSSFGEGYLRLWKQDGNTARNGKSVKDQGMYLAPGTYTLGKLELVGQTEARWYLEAVRVPDALKPLTLSVTMDLDGNGIKQTLANDSVQVTVVADRPMFYGDASNAPGGFNPNAVGGDPMSDAYSGAVRLADGSVTVTASDFVSQGLGQPWGLTRSWTSQPGAVTNSILGNGWAISELPSLIQATGSIIATSGGRNARYFDQTSDGVYKARFFTLDTLEEADLGDEGAGYVLTDTAGNKTYFYGLDSAQPGQFESFQNPAGLFTAVANYDEDGRLTSIDRGTGESFVYTYIPSGDNAGRLQSVTWTRGQSTVRKATYEYYQENRSDGAAETGGEQYGRGGDLKKVTVSDAGNNALDISYYRYDNTTGQLLYAVGPVAYQRMLQASITPETSTNEQIKQYAGQAFTYLSDGKVHEQTVQGLGDSGPGDLDAKGTISYTFHSVADGAIGLNIWKYQATENFGDGVTNTSYMNYAGEVMGSLTQDATSHLPWPTFTVYDGQGRVALQANPSAIATLNPSLPDLLGKENGNYRELRDDQGVITISGYAAASGGYLTGVWLKHGEQDTPRQQATYAYEPFGGAGSPVRLLSMATVYANDNGTGGIGTEFLYEDFTGLQPGTRRTKLPIVAGGTQRSIVETFDEYGRLETVTDADGYKNVTSFSDVTGAVTSTVVDEGGLTLTTTYSEFDSLGRPGMVTDPMNHVTHITYADTQTARSVTTTPSQGPSQTVQKDLAHGVVETYSYYADEYRDFQRAWLDYAGRTVQTDRYLTVPHTPENPGTAGVDFYRTSQAYDSRGRLSYTINAVGTVNKTQYDALGRPIALSVGTDPAATTVTTRYQYDNGGAGDGNLTSITLVPGGGAAERTTRMYYDWRGRLAESVNDLTATYHTLDNLGHQTFTWQYDATSDSRLGALNEGSMTAGVPNRPDNSRLRGLSQAEYDEQGRAFRTTVFNVGQRVETPAPTDAQILALPKLVTNVFHDGRGNVVETIAPGGLLTTSEYDGAGRLTLQQAGSEDTVLSEVERRYNDDGKLLLTITSDFDPSLGDFRSNYVRNYYDSINRLTATVNFGMTAVDENTSLPARQSSADGNDSYLITSYDYDGDWVYMTTDPRGLQTNTQHDKLGRVTKSISPWVSGQSTNADTNRRTEYEYNGVDQVTKTTRTLPSGDTEATSTEYDTLTGKPRLVTYPGWNAQSPELTRAHQDSYSYNLLGEVTSQADHNGPVHRFSYDVLGRLTSETMEIGNAQQMDTSAVKRTYQYDAMGRPVVLTSYGPANAGGGMLVVNQVRRDYNGFGQVVAEYQEPNGGVNPAKTLAVRYEYELVNNGSRLQRMIYPTTDAQFDAGQGRSLWYGYAGIDGIDNAISRVSYVADDAAGSQILESYDYRGMGTVEDLSRPLAGDQNLNLTLTFDDFGRTKKTDWSVDGQRIDGFAYWYDANSNLLTKQNLTNPNYSQLYHPSGSTADGAYDKLNQIKSYGLGPLFVPQDGSRPRSILSPSANQSWGTNAEGNAQRVMPPDDTRDRPIIQGAFTDSDMMSRLQTWSRQVGSGSEPKEAMAVRFDAWGNLAKMQEYSVNWSGINKASKTGERIFSYDPLNRRMAEAHNQGWVRSSTIDYHDLSGHVIEERTWRSFAADLGLRVEDSSRAQYLYSPATGQLILRDLDSDNNPATTGTGLPGGIDQRLYALADAQGNITAIANSSGAVVERYFYSPEGKLLITNGQWQTKDASGYDWRYTYQGGRLDGQGLYYVHGGEWDYRTGDPLKHDAMSYWGEHLSYTPPSLSFYDKAVIRVAPIVLGAVVGVATGGLGFAAAGFFGGYAGGLLGGAASSYAAGNDATQIIGDAAVGGMIGGFSGLAGGAALGRFFGAAAGGASREAATGFARQLGQQMAMGAVEGAASGMVQGGIEGLREDGWVGMLEGAGMGALYGAGIGALTAGAFTLAGPAARLTGRGLSWAARETAYLLEGLDEALGFAGSGGMLRMSNEQLAFDFYEAMPASRSNTTRRGIVRDPDGDWIRLRDSWDQHGYGDILSPANRDLIEDGYRPIVDNRWISAFPGDKALHGEIISPHHVGGYPLTVPLPYSRHLDAHMPGGFRYNPGGPGQSG